MWMICQPQKLKTPKLQRPKAPKVCLRYYPEECPVSNHWGSRNIDKTRRGLLCSHKAAGIPSCFVLSSAFLKQLSDFHIRKKVPNCGIGSLRLLEGSKFHFKRTDCWLNCIVSHLLYHQSVSSRVVNPWVEENTLGLYSFLCELFGGVLLASPTSQEPPHFCLLRNIHQSSICLGLQTLNNHHKIDVTLRLSQSANKLMKARNLLRGTQSVK